MSLASLKLSAQLAWQDGWVRWTFAAAAALLLVWGGFFLWRLVPEGQRAGILVYHYNPYFGIDDVRPWRWIALQPLSIGFLLVTDAIFAAGVYRHDRMAARALAAGGVALVILWVIASFFLIAINI